ncbi:hypothetical protein cand_031980 [Cryptosporidium andersoni]|uniref:Uncharacterized protein n=1 Tax=Cryptosporidium andersoni TaxID=117008 RepID=A0A1J4MF59_9CRYT|nr:hypothetical protein cand_031980 [Cryptosporidium andersoni]
MQMNLKSEDIEFLPMGYLSSILVGHQKELKVSMQPFVPYKPLSEKIIQNELNSIQKNSSWSNAHDGLEKFYKAVESRNFDVDVRKLMNLYSNSSIQQ